MASKAQIAANIRYNQRQDSITIRPAKDHGAEIRAAAQSAGQSLQGYILQPCRAARRSIFSCGVSYVRKIESYGQ